MGFWSWLDEKTSGGLVLPLFKTATEQVVDVGKKASAQDNWTKDELNDLIVTATVGTIKSELAVFQDKLFGTKDNKNQGGYNFRLDRGDALDTDSRDDQVLNINITPSVSDSEPRDSKESSGGGPSFGQIAGVGLAAAVVLIGIGLALSVKGSGGGARPGRRIYH